MRKRFCFFLFFCPRPVLLERGTLGHATPPPISARQRTKTRIAGFFCVPQARPDMWRCAWRAACFTCYCLFWLSHRRVSGSSVINPLFFLHTRISSSPAGGALSQSAASIFMCFVSHVSSSLVFSLQEKQDSSSTSLQLRSEIQVCRDTVLPKSPTLYSLLLFFCIIQESSWTALLMKKKLQNGLFSPLFISIQQKCLILASG